MRRRLARGFTLLEVAITGVLFAILMLAVLGILSQAQRDMRATATRTEIGEKARRAMDLVATELRESAMDHVIAGAPNKTGGNGVLQNYVTITGDPGLSQCPDPFCPWSYNASLGTYRPNEGALCRAVQMDGATAFAPMTPAANLLTPVTVTGRPWAGVTAGTSCPAGHAVAATTGNAVDVGIILFATARNRADTFLSREGADLSPDWQGLVCYCPYMVGAGVMELRRYVFYIDDLVNGDGVAAYDSNQANPTFGTGVLAPETGVTITSSGAGPGNTPFSTNNPVGKPTLADLLDMDGDGSIADGVLDASGTSAADATDEVLSVTTVSGTSLISYVKRGTNTATGATYDFTLTWNRESGALTCVVNNAYGTAAGSPTYAKTVTVVGRRPKILVSRLTDIEFATLINCAYDATDNPTGLVAAQDANVVRITALFDRWLGEMMGDGTIMRAVMAEQIVETRVQPRN